MIAPKNNLYFSYELKLYIKTVVLNEIYNFIIKKFLNWNCLGTQNIVVSAQISKFEI